MKRDKTLGVIGASSMVGSRFCDLSNQPLVKADLNGNISIDITNKESVMQFFQENDFDVTVLFSAFTDVDAAEKQRGNKNGSCWQINVVGATNIAEASIRYNKKLIFISTDFVFDGESGPYSEEDETGPNLGKVSWYGVSKIEAEEIISKSLKEFIILRISYPYRGRYNKKVDFAKQILQSSENNNLFPLFTDQQRTPTFIDDIEPCLRLLIKKESNGIYHLASRQIVSPYDFAVELLKTFGQDTSVVKKSKLELLLKSPSTTPRPLNGGLKTDKIIELGFKPTNWKGGIKKIFEQSKGQLI